MTTRIYRPSDRDQLIELIAEFHVRMRDLSGRDVKPDLTAASNELAERLEADETIFVAEIDGELVGYQVCRIDAPAVRLESVYVSPAFRRQGVATALFHAAEQILKDRGQKTFYVMVHPNNQPVINFLKKQRYDVLNLLELRKQTDDYQVDEEIEIMGNTFKY